MGLSKELRKRMSTYMQSSSKFHGEFKYPDWAFEFEKLADMVTVERPAVDSYTYKLYIFTAKNRIKNCPVHVNIHGGGFSNAHQINDSLYSAWLADQIHGIVVDVDYTLSGEAPWPVCFDQCYDAGKYTYEHCAEWAADPKRVSIGGYSAGGTLTTAVIMKAKETGEVSYCLAVNGYGPEELYASQADKPEEDGYWEKPEGRGMGFVDLLFDGDIDASKDPYFAASLATDEQLTGLPKFLVISAANDAFRFDNERFALRLATLGNEVTVCRVPDTVHGFIPHFMEHWQEGGEMVARAINHTSL